MLRIMRKLVLDKQQTVTNGWPEDDQPALLLCAKHGDADTDLLLDETPILDDTNDLDQIDALLEAAHYGQSRLVQRLLMAGFNPQRSGCRYEITTALHEAVKGRCPKTIEILLQAGADVNVANSVMGTPLQQAAAQGSSEIVTQLLRHGADAKVKGGLLGNAFQAAYNGNHSEVLDILTKDTDDMVELHKERTILWQAAYYEVAQAEHTDMAWLMKYIAYCCEIGKGNNPSEHSTHSAITASPPTNRGSYNRYGCELWNNGRLPSVPAHSNRQSLLAGLHLSLARPCREAAVNGVLLFVEKRLLASNDTYDRGYFYKLLFWVPLRHTVIVSSRIMSNFIVSLVIR